MFEFYSSIKALDPEFYGIVIVGSIPGLGSIVSDSVKTGPAVKYTKCHSWTVENYLKEG